jgi:hypothetical protein
VQDRAGAVAKVFRHLPRSGSRVRGGSRFHALVFVATLESGGTPLHALKIASSFPVKCSR